MISRSFGTGKRKRILRQVPAIPHRTHTDSQSIDITRDERSLLLVRDLSRHGDREVDIVKVTGVKLRDSIIIDQFI